MIDQTNMVGRAKEAVLPEVLKTVSSALAVAPGQKTQSPNSRQGISPYRARMGGAWRTQMENQVFIGIDVAKARLDAAVAGR